MVNLHSTMVLLKSNYIYIKTEKEKISTFHYGSIKILLSKEYDHEQTNLHSTMVLLKF